MKKAIYDKTMNSKGTHIFKQMLEDKNHFGTFEKGGKLFDLKDKYKFVTPLSLKAN